MNTLKRAAPVLGAFIVGIIVFPVLFVLLGGMRFLATPVGRMPIRGFGRGFGGFGFPMASAGTLGMLLFWGVVLVLGVLLLNRLGRGDVMSASPKADTALSILQRRYAAGEIDRATFIEARKDLQTASDQPGAPSSGPQPSQS